MVGQQETANSLCGLVGAGYNFWPLAEVIHRHDSILVAICKTHAGSCRVYPLQPSQMAGEYSFLFNFGQYELHSLCRYCNTCEYHFAGLATRTDVEEFSSYVFLAKCPLNLPSWLSCTSWSCTCLGTTDCGWPGSLGSL